MKFNRLTRVAAGVCGLMLGALGVLYAADHLDPSPRVGSPVGNAADIADLYAWNTTTSTATGNLVLALTFAGPLSAADFSADRDVLYAIHVDNDDEGFEADTSIYVRFAQDSLGRWGVQFSGVPGTAGPVEGRVGSILDLGGAYVYAGVREDPFFFDLQGFQETIQTGNLSFNPARDFFAGGNVSAIVVELPLRALPGNGPYRVWATTGRI